MSTTFLADRGNIVIAWTLPRAGPKIQEVEQLDYFLAMLPECVSDLGNRRRLSWPVFQRIVQITNRAELRFKFIHMLPRGSDTANSSTASSALALRRCLGFATVARPFVAMHFGQRAKNESRSKNLVITCDQSR
jgi:hypothetical protein